MRRAKGFAVCPVTISEAIRAQYEGQLEVNKMSDIKILSDKQISTMIDNYRRAEKSEGGVFTLAELLIEQSQRIDSGQPPRAIVDAICRLSRESDDGLTSYKSIWTEFYPDKDFVGNSTQKIVGKMLGSAAGYCAHNGLPALTTLVVPHNTRQLTDKAMENIHLGWQEFGRDVGSQDPRTFCEAEVIKAKELAQTWVVP